MRLATFLFCGAFVLGQDTSPTPQQKVNASAATTNQDSQNRNLGGSGAHGNQSGNIEILSDTQGVDFGPYLQRVLENVRKNWYNTIPESAQWKHGTVVIEFAITKDGGVTGMKMIHPDCGIIRLKMDSCGDAVLERAAWSGITASAPFPPLLSGFRGQYLALRFRFFYNPNKSNPAASLSKSEIGVSISPVGDDLQVLVGGSKVFTATVTGTQETSVEWSVTGSGCSDSLCGKMVKDMYLAPSVLPSPPLVTLTASSKADPTAKASVTVHIVQSRP
jgi:hypothetical protein